MVYPSVHRAFFCYFRARVPSGRGSAVFRPASRRLGGVWQDENAEKKDERPILVSGALGAEVTGSDRKAFEGQGSGAPCAKKKGSCQRNGSPF